MCSLVVHKENDNRRCKKRCKECQLSYWASVRAKKSAISFPVSKTPRLSLKSLKSNTRLKILQKQKKSCRRKEQKMAKKLNNLRNVIGNLQKDIANTKETTLNDILDNMEPKQKLAFQCCMDNARKSSNRFRYKTDWLLECLMLRIKSPKAYRHLRDEQILQLPHEKTILSLLRGCPCSFGLNEFALKSIQKELEKKDKKSRMGCVVFDEVKLKESISFNKDKHLFDGFVDFGDETRVEDRNKLADHALVFMFKTFNDNWAQPIAVFGSRGAAPMAILGKLLLSVILQLEENGCEVVSVVSDGASSNKSMWNSFGVSGEFDNVWNKIPHPCRPNEAYLHFVCDIPHVIKCIRNYFMKVDMAQWGDQTIFFSSYGFLLLADESDSGLRAVKKLTQAHVTPNNFQKMNVKLATQLFSKSVADGFRLYRTLKFKTLQNTEGIEEFTRFVNDLFDLLNGRLPKDGLEPNSPQLLLIDEFLRILDYTEKKYPNKMFVSSQTAESLRVTLQSVKDIIFYLTDNGYSYVLTAKLNQDCLEKFFGLIRLAGGSDEHPTVPNFLQLYRMLSLYMPLRRATKGNCLSKNGNENILVHYSASLIQRGNESREARKQLSDDIEEEIWSKVWLLEDTLDVQDHADYSICSKTDAIVYHFCGYILFKISRFTKCKYCICSLASNGIPPKESILTSIKSFGFLRYPSKNFYTLMRRVENFIEGKLKENGLRQDLFWSIIETLDLFSDKVGCDEHSATLIPQLVHYYVVTRMHFLARDINKKNSTKIKSQSNRKKAKI